MYIMFGSLIVLVILLGATVCALYLRLVFFLDKLRKTNEVLSRFRLYFETSNLWLKNRNNNRTADQYLLRNNLRTISIYGSGTFGQRLAEELKGTAIQIRSFLDSGKLADSNFDKKELEIIDAIIVTPIYDYEQIKNQLLEKGVIVPILSVEDIIVHADN